MGSALNATKTVAGSTTTKTLQIGNLHGDTLTSVTIPASGAVTPPQQLNLFDEYGLPKPTLNPTSNPFILNYASLGQAQRETSDTGIVLMGVRGYNPVTGQFLTSDPIPGGNETVYNYPNDPVNASDLNGLKKADRRYDEAIKFVFTVAATLVTMAACASLLLLGCMIAGAAVGAVSGFLSNAVIARNHGLSDSKILNAGLVGAAQGALTGAAASGLGYAAVGHSVEDTFKFPLRFIIDLGVGAFVDQHYSSVKKVFTKLGN